ncbi:MAG: septum site-determining protein MinC [Bacillota bacterium]|nr:septum site-determining protein MinC [Bacillota bacterium]
MNRVIEIKGTAQGAVIKLDPDAPVEDILARLEEQISGSAFYANSKFIGTTGRTLSYSEKAMLDEVIYRATGKRSVSLEEFDEKQSRAFIEKKVREEVLAEFQKILDEEMAPKLEMLEKENAFLKEKMAVETGNAMVHSGTLRSGTSIRFAGHVIVLGDINAGAEVIADGNIICLGKALGLLHAGAAGDENAFIVALHFAPTQIRIARYVSGPARGKSHKAKGVPEIAKLLDEKIVLEEV